MLSELLYIFITKSVFELYGIVISARDQVQFNLLDIIQYLIYTYRIEIVGELIERE